MADAISATSSATSANTLGQQDFMKLLLAQLTEQNPLKPMDNTEFVAQMAQFSALAQAQESSQRLGQLLTQQAQTQSIGMLSKFVTFSSGSGSQTGQVKSVSFDGETPSLSIEVSGQTFNGITLDLVTSIRN
jgi:flagellar basal-body rod modification protein FlgD